MGETKRISKVIESGSRFVVTTHLFPDADGIGASLALVEVLLHLGKKARFVCDSNLPEKFAFLDEREVFEKYLERESYEEADALILVDTNSMKRIGRVASLLDKNPKMECAIIDHHPIKKELPRHGLHDPTSCSSAALVYRLSKELGISLNLIAAKGIYAGLLFDTGRFCHTSTNEETHDIARDCLKIGVNPNEIYSKLYQQVSFEQFTVFSRAIERVETYCDHRIIIQQILREDYENMGEKTAEIQQMDFDAIHEFNKLIHEVEVVVLLSEQLDRTVRISLRSKTDLDVSKVVDTLGGGGHRKAAGAMWMGSIDDAKTKILELLFPLLESVG